MESLIGQENNKKRKILHVDMDAFFAAVEVLDEPEYKNKPLIVGGVSSRGVVATCSYEARKFGIKSAMPIFKARALCPNAVYVRPRHWRYKEISKEVFKILYRFTQKIEPLSIDEAFLDISHRAEDPVEIGYEIKRLVKEEVGLTISVGVSYNKFLAKIASDWNKPDGLKYIKEDDMPEILFPLHIREVYGIGAKSAERLHRIGVHTVKDLYNIPMELYKNFFGKSGEEIYSRIRGIDKREVSTNRERKSYGKETTFSEDIRDRDFIWEIIQKYATEISMYMMKKNVYGKTITIKYKTCDFETHTKSRTLSTPINTSGAIQREASEIYNEINFIRPLRLVGLTVSNLTENKNEQLSFF